MDNVKIKQHVARFNLARTNLVIVVVFTVINFFLVYFDTGYYFLFSAILPIMFVYANTALAIGILAAFFLCYLFAERLRALLFVGFILFIIDFVFMILLLFELGAAEFVLDIVFHVWITIILLLGAVSYFKLRGVSHEAFKDAKERVNTGPGVAGGIPVPVTGEGGEGPSLVFPGIHYIRCPKCGSSQIELTGVKGIKGKGVAQLAAIGAAGAVGGAAGGLAAGAIAGGVIGGVAGAASSATPIKPTVLLYRCGGCKERFEAEPHETRPDEVLEAPFTITLTKNVNIFLNEGVYVYINGVIVAYLNAAKSTITFQTTVRHNSIFLIELLGKKVKNGIYSFDASPGGGVNLLYNRKAFRAE